MLGYNVPISVADPDFELRWGPGFGLLALLTFLPSVISSFFTQNKGEGGTWTPLGPSPRSATEYLLTVCSKGLATFISNLFH